MSEGSLCLIEELRKLKESSKEAVENLDSFSSFKEYMHIKRNVEDELYSLIEQASKSARSQLVLVCGGVGDGKSHLISYFRKKYPTIINQFKLHNDATESFEPQKTSIDTLNDVLDDFSDEKLNQSTPAKLILAINLGALSNFIDSDYQGRFTQLRNYVIEKKIFESQITDNAFDAHSPFQFINFSDYHMYSLSKEGAHSDYIQEIFHRVTKEDAQNPFYEAYQNWCASTCELAAHCPVKSNYEFLQKSAHQKQVTDLIIEGMVKHKLIVSTRALLNFTYDLCVPAAIDRVPIEEVPALVRQLSFSERLTYTVPNLLFEHKDTSSIFETMARLDPVHNRSENMDAVLVSLNTKTHISELFQEHIDMDALPYVAQAIKNTAQMEAWLVEEKSLKGQLIAFFIRLYRFSAKTQAFDLQDARYLEYVKNLYFWNVQSKKDLQKIYREVKEAIYQWNGRSGQDQINLFIGKNQLKYTISEKLELVPDVGGMQERSEDVLDKFIPFLTLKYKKKDADKSYGISIDFALYDLLMKIRNGYRPNKKDKNNFINFVDFVNKITSVGGQDKELVFEEKHGEGQQRYKLVYDEVFEQFTFVVG